MRYAFFIIVATLFLLSCEEEETLRTDFDEDETHDTVSPYSDEDSTLTDADISDTDDNTATQDADSLLHDIDNETDKDNMPPDEDVPVSGDVDVDAGYPYGDISITLCDSYLDAKNEAIISAPELTEMSGFAVSLKNPGIIWTHNDSGNPAEVFALNKQGQLLGKVTLVGAEAEDWEDIALGRCGNDECIYIADTGNNLKKRTNLRVYRFIEPAVDSNTPFVEIKVTAFETFPFTYPDTTHDCEAIALNKEGVLYLFTKDIEANLLVKSKTFIYKFPALVDGVSQILFSAGVIETGKNLSSSLPEYAVTAASIDRTGTRLLLRMYMHLWEYRLPPGQPFEAIFTQSHTDLTAGTEAQGESVDYDPYTGTVYHTSELYKGVTPVLYGIECQ